MKRFFLYTALAFICAALLANYNIISFVTLAVVSLTITFLCILLKLKYKVKFLYLVIIIALFLPIFYFHFAHYRNANFITAEMLDNTSVTVVGKITEVSTNSSNIPVYTIKTSKIHGSNVNMNISMRITAYDRAKYSAGDIISTETKLKKPTGYVTEYFSDGVFLVGYSSATKLVKSNPNMLKLFASNIKNAIVKHFYANLSPSISGIPIGMLTGDKQYISDGFYDDLKQTGLVHVMAVSGLHISIICTFFLDLLKRLKFGNKPIAVIGFVLIFMLMAVAGFTGSVKRAGFMYIVLLLARLFSRRADALNSLGFAVTVLSVINPYTIFSTSFMMSALGTLGILLFGNRLYELLRIKTEKFHSLVIPLNYIINIFSISICAAVTITPISLFKFTYISVISPFVNIMASPIVWVSIITALFSLIFFPIPIVGGIILRINAVAVFVFKNIIEYCADFKYSLLYKTDITVIFLIICAVITAVLLLIFKRNNVLKIATIFAVIIAFQVASIMQTAKFDRRVSIDFYNCNGNMCVLLQSGEDAIIITNATTVKSFSEVRTKLDRNFNTDIRAVVVLNKYKSTKSAVTSAFKNSNVYEFIYYQDNAQNMTITLKNRISVSLENRDNAYSAVVQTPNYTVLIDSRGTNSRHADCIFTSYPTLSYKIHKNSANYLTVGDSDSAGYINSHGGKAISVNTNLSCNNFQDNLLIFTE